MGHHSEHGRPRSIETIRGDAAGNDHGRSATPNSLSWPPTHANEVAALVRFLYSPKLAV